MVKYMTRVFAIIGAIFFVIGTMLTVGLGFMAVHLYSSPGNEFYQQPWAFVFPGIGLIFGIIGTIFLLIAFHKHKRRRWLLENGEPVWAHVQGTDVNHNIQINGRPVAVLVATYKQMRFVSDPISNRKLVNVGEHVKVLLHPDNYDRYTFDFNNESHLHPSEPPTKQHAK